MDPCSEYNECPPVPVVLVDRSCEPYGMAAQAVWTGFAWGSVGSLIVMALIVHVMRTWSTPCLPRS